MRLHYCLIFSLLIFFTSCKCRSERLNSSETNEQTEEKTIPGIKKNKIQTERKIGKVVFYLENSESMCGYVCGYTNFVDVISDLAEKPEFVEQNIQRQFYFVNGKDIEINHLGNSATILKTKLNNFEYRKYGDIRFSNLNSMFQIALETALNDTIAILVSDAIYDVGYQSTGSSLITEGKETRTKFIKRLTNGDIQTIVIKLNSHFSGKYFPVGGGTVRLTQSRPYYVWIFGDSELLNKYFTEEYIKSLEGFSDVARFLKISELKVPYQVTAHKQVGNFKFDKKNKNKLISVKKDRNEKGFHFTLAVDYSELPFSDSYLTSLSNYTCNNSNFSVIAVSGIGNIKLYGLNFSPTHLITVGTNRSPLCQLNISLKNTVPKWIEDTNIDDETNIIGDTTHTFGFKFLTNALCEAYQYKNKESNIVTFKIELIK